MSRVVSHAAMSGAAVLDALVLRAAVLESREQRYDVGSTKSDTFSTTSGTDVGVMTLRAA